MQKDNGNRDTSVLAHQTPLTLLKRVYDMISSSRPILNTEYYLKKKKKLLNPSIMKEKRTPKTKIVVNEKDINVRFMSHVSST